MYSLSLHDALPILNPRRRLSGSARLAIMSYGAWSRQCSYDPFVGSSLPSRRTNDGFTNSGPAVGSGLNAAAIANVTRGKKPSFRASSSDFSVTIESQIAPPCAILRCARTAATHGVDSAVNITTVTHAQHKRAVSAHRMSSEPSALWASERAILAVDV